MTPDEARDLPGQARRILPGTTPGPWEVETVPEMRYYDGETWETPGKIVVYADEATLFVAADEFVGDEGDEHDNEKNVRLAAAAPAMAAMIAGMREEWGYEYESLLGGRVTQWGFKTKDAATWDRNIALRQRWDDHQPTRIVRRYVTTPEEA